MSTPELICGATTTGPRRRVALFVSHPIQYYAPWFRHLARWLELEVFYAMRGDAMQQARAGFGVEFEWDSPLLEGYGYRFLRNVSSSPGLTNFRGCDTPEVESILRRERFDAAIVVGWNRKSSLQAIWAALRSGVPVFLRGDSQLATYRSRLTRAAKFLPFRFLLPRATGHLFVGQRNREYLRFYGVPESKLFLVPHCVDTDEFARAALAARNGGASLALRDALGVPSGGFLCGFVGKLVDKKRPLDLIRALQSPTCSDMHAVLIGDGILRPRIEEAMAVSRGRLRLVGFRNQSELPAHYAALDCLVLPSDAGETWGLVVNEAAACGVPAVVSDEVGCAPDMIDGARTGLTFRCGDIAHLASRLDHMRRIARSRPVEVSAALAQRSAAHSIYAASAGLARALATLARR